MAKVPHVPTGYHAVTPYLLVRGAAQALEYYKAAFGATEIMRMPAPGGKIGHAEIKIGDSHIMLADENPEMGFVGPQTLGGAGSSILLYVEDVDATFIRAVQLGAKAQREIENKFYGDRAGTLVDPFGHQWTVSTHIEDVSEDEMRRRMASMAA
jgi:PhnB protein